MIMKRGDIYFANLDPTIGAEIKKKRPVLIVSNNANNKMAKTVTVIPITSNVKKIHPFEVMLKIQDSKLPKNSKAQCQQIRTISKMRIQTKKVGQLNQDGMIKIHAALKIHLDL